MASRRKKRKRKRNRKVVQGKARKRYLIALRDGYRCAYCGDRKPPFELEHIIPRSRGGGNQLSNLAFACPPCNQIKANKLPHKTENKTMQKRIEAVQNAKGQIEFPV